MDRLRILLEISFRNLFASRMNVIIGLIMLGGTFLVVVGSAMFGSVIAGMSRSVTGSVAGHIQVYSERSTDELAIFGQMGGEEPNLSPMAEFEKVRRAVEAHPNVKVVVPMGFTGSMLMSGNTIDLTLAKLRELHRERAAHGPDAGRDAQIQSLKAHVRELARLLQQDVENVRKITSSVEEGTLETVQTAVSDAFWADYDQRPFEKLEWLENKLAQLMTDGDIIYMRFAGVDFPAFLQAFDRLRIVDGAAVPPNTRGLLLAKFIYEELFKLKPARRLDQLKDSIEINGKRIDGDPDLQRRVKELSLQTREILFQLDPLRQQELVRRLQRSLGSPETDPERLLQALLTLTDDNFADRYRIFYADVATLLELYRVKIGDTLDLQAFGRSGYAQTATVKVHGTFEFAGLEKSPLAGATSLMDLVTFRELYGFLTPEKLAEIQQLQAQTGARFVARESAEAELFGGDTETVERAQAQAIDEDAVFGQFEREAVADTFRQEEVDRGVVINAAVVLDDPGRLDDTVRELRELSRGQGLGVKVVSWEEASGILGDMVVAFRFILLLVAGFIFLIAIVIINNAVMMATMQRVREIGTLRAIGGQKAFVLAMILVETIVLGGVFGAGGALLGGVIIRWLGMEGIPATNDELYFFFSGPRLFPTLSAFDVVLAFSVVLFVSAVSALYPAVVATRVQPVTAMQAAEE